MVSLLIICILDVNYVSLLARRRCLVSECNGTEVFQEWRAYLLSANED
jgi:hypothetical protein